MDAGIAHFQNKDFAKAEKSFRELAESKAPVPIVGKARFNLGLTLRTEKKYAEAIKVFENILSSAVDDREPGEHLMEEFMNYRYRSCLQISACYEAQSNLPKALAYAELARGKYRYEAHCGTCAEGAEKSLNARLKTLKEKAGK